MTTRGLPMRLEAIICALFIEQRDLAELAELKDVVLENLVLLALGQAGVLQVGGERLQQLGVGDDVAADFLCRAASPRSDCRR